MTIAAANAYSYIIARMDDDGQWQYMDRFSTYSDAEMHFDQYCDMYPNAYIDIINTPE